MRSQRPVRFCFTNRFSIQRNKPFWMNEKAFEFGMSLFDRGDAWNAWYSPFDVVGSILKAEGVHTTSTAKAIHSALSAAQQRRETPPPTLN